MVALSRALLFGAFACVVATIVFACIGAPGYQIGCVLGGLIFVFLGTRASDRVSKIWNEHRKQLGLTSKADEKETIERSDPEKIERRR